MEKKSKRTSVYTLAVNAILIGLMILLAFTPLGIIPIPPANMSLLCLPVIIGTIACGLRSGLVLGAIFGITSTIKAFTTPSALVVPLLGASPAGVVIMSIAARLLIPVVTWLVYKAFEKNNKNLHVGTGVAALAGSLTNTVFYLGLMLLFYATSGLDSAAVLAVVGGVGALNGSLEAAAAIIVCTPVMAALRKMRKNKSSAKTA